MRIAVIGAGLFGATAAIHAARAGHDVTLFDKAGDIMTGATRVNQFRLHRGYHYPRSDSTVAECLESMGGFMREYGAAVVSVGEQYYAIARGSKTSAAQYVDFMDRHGLEYEIEQGRHDLFNHHLLEAAFRVREGRIDYDQLRWIVDGRLREWGVERPINFASDLKWTRNHYDHIIVAGYAGTNEILKTLGCEPMAMQYEYVEKPVVTLPAAYRNIGVVLMDGPYGCIDPRGYGQHLMGHVEYAVRQRWNGVTSEVGCWHQNSKFDKMQGALSEYLPFVSKAERVTSNYTTRVVLPNKDATDERPTLVRRIDEKVLMIFSGKLGHAVRAAEESLMMLDEKVAA